MVTDLFWGERNCVRCGSTLRVVTGGATSVPHLFRVAVLCRRHFRAERSPWTVAAAACRRPGCHCATVFTFPREELVQDLGGWRTLVPDNPGGASCVSCAFDSTLVGERSEVLRPLIGTVLTSYHLQAIYELQMNSEKLKGPLQECHITAAKEIDVGDGKQAIVVFVPVPMLAQFQKLTKERSLIEELEKKFAGKSVLIIAEVRAHTARISCPPPPPPSAFARRRDVSSNVVLPARAPLSPRVPVSPRPIVRPTGAIGSVHRTLPAHMSPSVALAGNWLIRKLNLFVFCFARSIFFIAASHHAQGEPRRSPAPAAAPPQPHPYGGARVHPGRPCLPDRSGW